MAQLDYRFQQGESRILELPIMENATTAVDGAALSSAPQIYVRLMVGSNAYNFAKEQTGTAAGYGKLTVSTEQGKEHHLLVEVERAMSKNMAKGDLYATVVVEYTDTDFTSGKRVEEYNLNKIGMVLEGKGADLEFESA